MASVAVGYDALGNEIDAEGNVIPIGESYPDEEPEKLSPRQKMERRGFERMQELATKKQQWAREGRDARIAQVRERGTPEQLAAVLKEERGAMLQVEADQAAQALKKEAESARLLKAREVRKAEEKAVGLEGRRAELFMEAMDAGIKPEEREAYVESKLAEESGALASMPPEDELQPALEGDPAEEEGDEVAAHVAEDQDVMDAINEEERLGNIEANRAARAFEAMEERQRVVSERVEKEIAAAESDLRTYVIDPKRAFKSMGSQIAAAFAIAMGGLASGLSGGKLPNTAFKIIDNAIARDIEAQKAELGKRKDVLKNKNNVYARMLQKFGNERAAEVASITLGLTAAENQIDEIASRFPGARQQEVAAGAKAKIQGQKAKRMLDLKKIQNTRARATHMKAGQTQYLFETAHIGAQKLLKMWNQLDAAESMTAGALGFFGDAPAKIFSNKKNIAFTAQVQSVSQSINKAFSGARGSDRDLAAVLLQMPDSSMFFSPSGRENGRVLIMQLIENLDLARKKAGGGLIAKDTFANSMVASRGITEAQINEMLASDEFNEFKSFIDKGTEQ